MKKYFSLILIALTLISYSFAANDLIIDVDNRETMDLNGKWNVVVDPYNTGDRLYKNKMGFFLNEKPTKKWEKFEYSFDTDQQLNVPGDWNSQQEKLFFYEGPIWYKKSFDYLRKNNKRVFLYFGAANYIAQVGINGTYIGNHEGGYTPFNFEITDRIKDDNFIVVKVDNQRQKDGVPTLNTDWFNYGGLTRRVLLIETPETFIRDYFIQLKKGSKNEITGFIQLDGSQKQQQITVKIPEARVSKKFQTDENGRVKFTFKKNLKLWSPENPKLYDVVIESETDKITDRIGFRTIETKGTDILLNGKSIYLRGISLHEEAPFMDGARAHSMEHANVLLGWAKELQCNFVRLAHYPHNENMVRLADEMGLLVWSEIPVYWGINWENEETYKNAENQLSEMITRDKNRAAIIIWSMANETPVEESRLVFLNKLVDKTREMDPTRLISAAMKFKAQVEKGVQTLKHKLEDPFAESLDIIGVNKYLGWYYKLPSVCDSTEWFNTHNKPIIVSEFGGGALYGFHGDSLTVWSEEYQENLYKHNIKMFDKVPSIRGMSPWILKDFRSPKRLLPRIQDYWNRKGLVDDQGNKKKAFDVLKAYYEIKKSE